MPLEFSHRFFAGGSACHHLHVRFAGDDQRDSFTHDPVVVDAEDADREVVIWLLASYLWCDRNAVSLLRSPCLARRTR